MRIVDLPVDMIATFTGTRSPVPYKFRYMTSRGERVEVRVDRVARTEKSRLAGNPVILYTCQSEIDGYLRVYELMYIIGQYRWELHKI